MALPRAGPRDSVELREPRRAIGCGDEMLKHAGAHHREEPGLLGSIQCEQLRAWSLPPDSWGPVGSAREPVGGALEGTDRIRAGTEQHCVAAHVVERGGAHFRFHRRRGHSATRCLSPERELVTLVRSPVPRRATGGEEVELRAHPLPPVAVREALAAEREQLPEGQPPRIRSRSLHASAAFGVGTSVTSCVRSSRTRWAYSCVVLTFACPINFWTSAILCPFASSVVALLCLRS